MKPRHFDNLTGCIRQVYECGRLWDWLLANGEISLAVEECRLDLNESRLVA